MHSAVYTISLMWFFGGGWGGGGDETPKICRKFRQNFGKISWAQNVKKNTALAIANSLRVVPLVHSIGLLFDS